jgi:predicted Zn-dependent protease
MIRKGLGSGCTVIAALGGLLLSCATNPVTGKRQLALISEAQEIAMGREADTEVAAAYGLYPDDQLQQYVQALGSSIASRTERPSLPWTFRVVDDASVNAFAIPGGFIYVTRGILAHLNSEAELAAVLGHEIGHVTARHSVTQMSKQQLAQVGLVAGMVVSPQMAQFGNLAQSGLGMLFLKFGRTDESQADSLGFRYMLGDGYDPREMVDVFRMLASVSAQSKGEGRLPQWLSSHPDPENRQAWAARQVASLNREFSGLAVNRPAYLRHLDGMVFGENPREGFFQDATFRHPDLAFRLEFPRGWKGINEKQVVGAVSANQDAIITLQIADAPSARQAAENFFSQQGIQEGSEWRRQIGGLPAVSGTFEAPVETTTLRGLVAFVEYRDRVFRLLGYTPIQRWPAYEQALGSFGRETDPTVLNVQPRRLELVSVTRPGTLDVLNREYPSTVPAPLVGLINSLEGGRTLAAGETFKRVVGGPNW